MAGFDPYYRWLAIPPDEQPPNYYRLLGVSVFESDANVIDVATNQRMAYLHSCSTGEHAELAEQLMNEITAARLCLLDQRRKAIYDQSLRRKLLASKQTPTTGRQVQSRRPKSQPSKPEASRAKSKRSAEPGTKPSQKKNVATSMVWLIVGGASLMLALIVSSIDAGSDSGEGQELGEELGVEAASASSGDAQPNEKAAGQPIDIEQPKELNQPKLQPRFLAELFMTSVHVAHQDWFSRQGLGTTLSVRNRTLLFGAAQTPSPHGIYMHPGRNSFSRVIFRLDKPYRTLKTAAAIPVIMNERRQGDAVTPLTFQVFGDGRSLWESTPIRLKGTLQECEVSLEGVSELELRVDCPGADNWAVAAWFEPTLYFLDSSDAAAPLSQPTSTDSPRVTPDSEPGWVRLLDTAQSAARHWRKGDNRGQYSYNFSTRCISVNSPYELGTVVYNESWEAFEFDIRATKLSFSQFDLVIDNQTLKLGTSVLGENQWKHVRIDFDSPTRTLRALVDSNLVAVGTQLAGKATNQLKCRFRSTGGQNAVFDLRNLKIQ